MSDVSCVSVTIEVSDAGYKEELIDRYIRERGEGAQFNGVVSQLFSVGSREDKLDAAKKIKVCVEAGEDLESIYQDIFSQIQDNGELRKIYDQYKRARVDTLAQVRLARSKLPNNILNAARQAPAIPVSVKNKFGVEKVSEYIENRRNDPRETKSVGAMAMSLFGGDSMTKTGKIRAATLLESAALAGIPLALAFNAESAALGEGMLKVIFSQYDQEQQRLENRMKAARRELTKARVQSSPSPSGGSKFSEDMKAKYRK